MGMLGILACHIFCILMIIIIHKMPAKKKQKPILTSFFIIVLKGYLYISSYLYVCKIIVYKVQKKLVKATPYFSCREWKMWMWMPLNFYALQGKWLLVENRPETIMCIIVFPQTDSDRFRPIPTNLLSSKPFLALVPTQFVEAQ